MPRSRPNGEQMPNTAPLRICLMIHPHSIPRQSGYRFPANTRRTVHALLQRVSRRAHSSLPPAVCHTQCGADCLCHITRDRWVGRHTFGLFVHRQHRRGEFRVNATRCASNKHGGPARHHESGGCDACVTLRQKSLALAASGSACGSNIYPIGAWPGAKCHDAPRRKSQYFTVGLT